MDRIREQVVNLSNMKSPILIQGDIGTEKREVALAIHEEGNRREEAYSVNCKIYTEETLETELMGTTVPTVKKGKIELLKAGTLILEEVDSLPLPLQAKILCILEEGVIYRKGGKKSICTDIRIIATTAKDLLQLVRQGSFMEELYYKLIVNTIILPPLVSREKDVSIYGRHYLENYARKYGKTIFKIDEKFFSCLEQYPWTGNIWELKGVMEHVINVMGLDGRINTSALPDYFFKQIKDERRSYNLKEMEKKTIKKALEEIGYDSKRRKEVADELGVGIATLYRSMKAFRVLGSIKGQRKANLPKFIA